MSRAPRVQGAAPDKDEDCVWRKMRFSNEAWDMIEQMAEARGGGNSAKHLVLEEAVRLWFDQDPMIARRKRKGKAAPAPEGAP